ncbi:MAG: hypothetical protein GWN99_06515 [Gemmatimonadetes bacterium]|uniref:Uncharacterized protein n=1 Tax=Candidatus Kutchimonas denitrificans TaxID=3056748 RepID=A0AAE5CAT6_9BACT|nr:hypothetical protein [Candidatus Kutchimonas denitrificans]NIS00715.1 hypothetical protein [Gemmatimonadota bacterium]NIU51520.1 hypothetical protein [Gemmatimonadota bacterium]NIV22859.1 hypothetical protein [Gemmatimonadota bacterium]NIW36595.1 hypothetical protein [Gemmatimonadota bacterium]
MLAVALGIVTIRAVDLFLIGALAMGSQTAFAISSWHGWIITVGAAEIWIRMTRSALLTHGPTNA